MKSSTKCSDLLLAKRIAIGATTSKAVRKFHGLLL
jgi:hypothetical protein